MRPQRPATVGRSTKPAVGILAVLLAATTSIACSGAYVALDDSALVTWPDTEASPTRPSMPRGPVPGASDATAAETGVGLEPNAAADAAADAAVLGCVEPEPNDDPTKAPLLPSSFTCGRLSDAADVDYFARRTVAGERAIRIVSPAGPAGDALAVTVQANGDTFVLGRDDKLLVAVGVTYTFQVRSMSNLPTAYGILVE